MVPQGKMLMKKVNQKTSLCKMLMKKVTEKTSLCKIFMLLRYRITFSPSNWSLWKIGKAFVIFDEVCDFLYQS